MNRRYWKIEGYDGVEKIFEKKIRAWTFSETQIEALLKALVARAGLEFEDILGAYARRGSKESNDLLAVRREGEAPVFTCGENPHFIATVIKENNL